MEGWTITVLHSQFELAALPPIGEAAGCHDEARRSWLGFHAWVCKLLAGDAEHMCYQDLDAAAGWQAYTAAAFAAAAGW